MISDRAIQAAAVLLCLPLGLICGCDQKPAMQPAPQAAIQPVPVPAPEQPGQLVQLVEIDSAGRIGVRGLAFSRKEPHPGPVDWLPLVGIKSLDGDQVRSGLSRAFMVGFLSNAPSVRVKLLPSSHVGQWPTNAPVWVYRDCDGACLNTELLRHGFAIAEMTDGVDDFAALEQLQAQAKEKRLGFWREPPGP